VSGAEQANLQQQHLGRYIQASSMHPVKKGQECICHGPAAGVGLLYTRLTMMSNGHLRAAYCIAALDKAELHHLASSYLLYQAD